LLDLIEAAIRGENVLILKDDHPVVQFMPVELPNRHPQFGSAKGLGVMDEDFDAISGSGWSHCPGRAAGEIGVVRYASAHE